VAEDYLPDALIGTKIYEPSSSGFEAEHRARLAELERRKKS
jgi:replication-associated recombination protein RarA